MIDFEAHRLGFIKRARTKPLLDAAASIASYTSPSQDSRITVHDVFPGRDASELEQAGQSGRDLWSAAQCLGQAVMDKRISHDDALKRLSEEHRGFEHSTYQGLLLLAEYHWR